MRFLILHTTNAHWESGAPPGPELVARVGRLIGEVAERGVLRDAAGLRASALGARVRFSRGVRTITPGPFPVGKGVPAGFAVVRAASLEEAIELTTKLGTALGDADLEVRPVTEAWDIGLGPKPEGVTTRRYMAVHNVVAPTSAQEAALARVLDELTQAGVLLAAERMQPGGTGTRVVTKTGRRTVVDGPFAESKELIAGYVILELPSQHEATEWALRYAEVVDSEEVDVRPLVDG